MDRRLASLLRTLGMSPAHSRRGLRSSTGALPFDSRRLSCPVNRLS